MKSILIQVFTFTLLFLSGTQLGMARKPDAALPDPGTIPKGSGVSEATSLIETVSLIILWALGFIGIVIFVILLFAGFEYATAGGDSAKAETAQKRIGNAIIGLIIVFFVFVLSNTVLGFVFQDANTIGGTTNTTPNTLIPANQTPPNNNNVFNNLFNGN